MTFTLTPTTTLSPIPTLTPTRTSTRTPTQTPTPAIDAFKCYNISVGSRPDLEAVASLKDRYETKTTLIKRGEMWCTPVDVDGKPRKVPDNDLLCYTIEDQPGPPSQPSFTEAGVNMQNGLPNGNASFTIDRSQMVCVPSRIRP
jgi:hypothetical protein